MNFNAVIDYPIFLLLSVLVASILYSSVGHGGASGYLAAMALFGVDPEVMRPAALVMNIFVTFLVLYKSRIQSQVNWHLLKALIIVSIPFAYLGGAFTLETQYYKYLLGVALLFAAWKLFLCNPIEGPLKTIKTWNVVIVGGALGFASGLTGIGGGIFLSPLLLLSGWTSVQGSIPIVATFVLVNSASGLFGYLVIGNHLPDNALTLVIIAIVGAIIGTELAFRRLSGSGLRAVLGVVLVVAGSKMLLTA